MKRGRGPVAILAYSYAISDLHGLLLVGGG